MRISSKSLYHIDLQQKKLREPSSTISTDNLKNFTTMIIEELFEKRIKARDFTPVSETTEFMNGIEEILNGNEQKGFDIIANRLLREELRAQENIKQLSDIQTGSLLQIYNNINNTNYLIIAKVDHIDFLDEADFAKRSGIPFKQKILKSCFVSFHDDNKIDEIKIHENRNKLTKYWWEDFLELRHLNSDEQNTKRLNDGLDKLLVKTLKKKYLSDYYFFKNAMLTYLRQQEEDFRFENLVTDVVDRYEPHNPNMPLDIIRRKILEMPERHEIDKSFPIVKSQIKLRKKDVIALNDKIDLVLKDVIVNLKNIVMPHKYEGEKYLLIKSEKGYHTFSREFLNEEN